ncbi:RHS repeat domain-containing protein [Citrobacter cronae]|uniref:RHS repeat domain-containing protein n=1 Tax=Citrobacter cronae TaxID=1748967 RepID=UPI0021D00679|nr:RHS repeat-associated core domain-containing protein [Citrobacter cronae]MCU6173816.1 RHS repeat-associated core domain-containing protein [Citrobacter cronae]
MAQNYYSQAGNFTSSLQAEVDVRTGLYKCNFPILNITGNHGIGPVQDITLSYTPLDTLNRGFGQGWGLGLSYYDKKNGLLVTANGEQYKIVENTTSVMIQQNKLENIKFEKFTDHYKLIYKSGVVEILNSPTSVNNVKVPVTIYSPLGRALQLQWNLAGDFPQLLSIEDEDNTLLKIDYSGYTTITVWPLSIEEKKIRVIQSNQQLTSFSIIQDSDSPVWNLEYHTVGGHSLLHGISTPSGMSESVTYVANQIKFPSSAGQTSLPRVTAHTRLPGAQQLPILRTYQYSTNNYLGYGLSAPWSASSDYLYNITTNYLYWSEERLTDGEELIVTRRTFDNFHLLREESTIQNDCQKLTTADYYAISGATYDNQPDNFLCQKNKVVTYRNTVTNEARSETTTYEYSLDGNMLSQTEPDGKTTTWEYFPAIGGAECPADPHGFCRYIKSETVTPAATEFDTPVKAKYYTYISIPTAAGAQEVLDHSVVQSTVLSMADKKVLLQVVQEYLSDNTSPYYGQVFRSTISKAGVEGGELDYVSKEETKWETEDIYATRTVTYYPFDYDGTNHTTMIVKYYPLSLKEYIVTDTDGNTTEYHYDVQDRLTKSIKNKLSIYETNLNYTYQMEEIEPESNVFVPTMTIQDEKGNISKNFYDGLGNIVRQAKLINDVWTVVFERKYDYFGREYYNDRRDRLNDIDALVSQNMAFNDWGMVESIQYNDGHYEYNDYDPITMQATLWQESATESTARTVTQYNVNGAVTSQWKINSLGQSIGVKNYHYDGLAQLRSIVDDAGVFLTYDYDGYGRVTQTTLADGTKVRKVYAGHTNEKLITHIYADDRLLGEQTFDGLGRLKTSTVANRTQQFEYELDKACPYWTLTQDGQELQYEYITELGNVVRSVKDKDALILQEMTYDPVSGDLLTGVNAEGIKFVNTYNNDSTLATETFTDNGRTVSTNYTFSGNGVLLDYVGVDNNNRHSTFNVLGQCLNITEGNITLDNEFDTLGRIKKITTTDAQFSSVSTMEIHYDEFSREWTRSFSCGGQTRNVEQLYYPDDSLKTRITREGETVLLREEFAYTNRNQLYTYAATGEQLPVDKFGNEITNQVYTYDGLGNIKDITTTFVVGENFTEYHYDLYDPCQLKRIVNSHDAYPKETLLEYDLAGRLTTNEVGNTLTYDALGRLQQILSGGKILATYHYDAMDRMVRQLAKDGGNTQLYYREGSVVSQYNADNVVSTDFVKVANTILARKDSTDSQLYLADFKGTPLSLVDSQSKTIADTSFTAFGESSGNTLPAWSPAFNGQVRDPVSGYYHLGSGYRAYNPELMRFNTPDSWSPFGEGGINPYAYCRNDPINFIDPTGHISWQAGVSIGFSVLSILLTIFTAGAAIIVAGGISAAIASAEVAALVLGSVKVVGNVASITSKALEETNPDVANAFSWVSKACSLISFGSAVPKVPGYIKQAPEKILYVWSKARGRTGSYTFPKPHDTRSLMVRTADRYMKVTDSTGFSIGYHILTGGTKAGIKVYDYVSQKKEDTTSGQTGSDTPTTDITNNTQAATSDLKSSTVESFYASSTGMQSSEDSGVGALYSAQKNMLTETLAPLNTQLKNTGVRLVNENSLTPWASTVTTKM